MCLLQPNHSLSLDPLIIVSRSSLYPNWLNEQTTSPKVRTWQVTFALVLAFLLHTSLLSLRGEIILVAGSVSSSTLPSGCRFLLVLGSLHASFCGGSSSCSPIREVHDMSASNGIAVPCHETRICVVMVGLPARGKSFIAQKGT